MPRKSKKAPKKQEEKKDQETIAPEEKTEEEEKEEAQEASAPEGEGGKTAKEKPTTSSNGKRKCVLIVEDERPLAHALELKFAHEGFEPHIALDGEQALECMKKSKPVAVLLDLIMPKLDGFAFLEELKKKKSKVPVVILTNLGQEEDEKRAMELGAKGYFVKSNTPISDIVKHVKAAS